MTTTTVTCGDQNLEHDCDVAAQTHNHGKYIFNINICGDDDCGCSSSGTSTGNDGSGTGGDGTGTDGTDGTGTGGDGTGTGGDGSSGDGSNTNNRLTDYFIVETGSSAATEQFYDMTIDDEGNVYAVGDMYENATKALVVKYDKLGSVLTQSNVSLTSQERFTAITRGDDGFIYVAGPSNSVSDITSRLNILVAKFNDQLELQDSILIKSNNREEVKNIAVDNDGNVYVAGYSQVLIGSTYPERPTLIKVNADFSSTTMKYIDYGNGASVSDISFTSSGRLIISAADYAAKIAYISLLDTDLTPSKSIEFKGEYISVPNVKIKEVSNGRYLAAISQHSAARSYLVELDENLAVTKHTSIRPGTTLNEITSLDSLENEDILICINKGNIYRFSNELLFKNGLSMYPSEPEKVILDNFGRVLTVGRNQSNNSNATFAALPDHLTISADANALNSLKTSSVGANIEPNIPNISSVELTLVGGALYSETPTLTVETPTLPSITNELQA